MKYKSLDTFFKSHTVLGGVLSRHCQRYKDGGKKIHVLKQYCDLSINKKLCVNFMFLYFVNVDKGVMFNLVILIMLLSLQSNENFSNIFKNSLSGKDCPGQKFCRAALAFYSTQSIFTNLRNSKSVFIISWFPWVRSSGIVKESSAGKPH